MAISINLDEKRILAIKYRDKKGLGYTTLHFQDGEFVSADYSKCDGSDLKNEKVKYDYPSPNPLDDATYAMLKKLHPFADALKKTRSDVDNLKAMEKQVKEDGLSKITQDFMKNFKKGINNEGKSDESGITRGTK